jgi:two-component system KDP operon response regulator KdpE
MARVLVIDDDRALLKALTLALAAGGHEVSTAPSGDRGLTQTALDGPEVVILDLGLPDVDGLEVLRRIREWSAVPVVVLSAADDEARKVAALDSGADDYVTKPFGMAELQARIRAALRHGHDAMPAEPTEISAGPVHLDLVHHEAAVGGTPVELTAKEFDLLGFLARHAGRTATHEMILGAVWGPGYGREAQYVHAYVHRLRQKLGEPGVRLIRTVPGIGYVLDPDA